MRARLQVPSPLVGEGQDEGDMGILLQLSLDTLVKGEGRDRRNTIHTQICADGFRAYHLGLCSLRTIGYDRVAESIHKAEPL